MRGDLDKPKVVHIDEAKLEDRDDSLVKPDANDAATTCRGDDDRNIQDFEQEDYQWQGNWTQYFQLPAVVATLPTEPSTTLAPTEFNPFSERDSSFDDNSAAQLLATAAATQPQGIGCLLYTSPSPRDQRGSRMPSSA